MPVAEADAFSPQLPALGPRGGGPLPPIAGAGYPRGLRDDEGRLGSTIFFVPGNLALAPAQGSPPARKAPQQLRAAISEDKIWCLRAEAAVRIQTQFRQHSAMRHLASARRAAVRIQAQLRGWRVRARVRAVRAAVRVLAARWRRAVAARRKAA